MAFSKPVYFHPDLVIHWRGFEASALRLKQAGWDIQIQEEHNYARAGFTCYISLTHEEHAAQGTGGFFRNSKSDYLNHDQGHYFSRNCEVDMQFAGSILLDDVGFRNRRFRRIGLARHLYDFEQQGLHRYEEKALKHMPIQVLLEPHESWADRYTELDSGVLIADASVDALLEEIKRKQKPKAIELLKQKHKEAKITAKIITLDSYSKRA